MPGARGQPHQSYEDANHFIQEDKGEDLARRVVDFVRGNSIGGVSSSDLAAAVLASVARE